MQIPKMTLGAWAFCFGPYGNDPWPLSKVLQYLADNGYDGVELCGFQPHVHPDNYDTPEKLAELRKEIEGHGLGISGIAADFMATPPAVCDTAAYLAAVRTNIGICQALGVPGIRVDSVSPPDELAPDEYEKRFAQLTKNWTAAAEECAQAGLKLVWEFEPGFWLNKPSEVVRLTEAVGHDNFKLMFDTSHAYMGAVMGARQTGEPETLPGGVPEYAALLGDKIGHLHLIDSDGTLHGEETSTHSPFGDGHVDFVAALTPIKDVIANFEYWCTDFCFCADTEARAKDAADYMRGLAREVLS